MNDSHYDVAIIGAGMSGLAAGIRLAHFGKRVCLFERHNAPGGLNSFYSIAGRKFDVGLHAMTNFVRPGVKGTPLGKLLRQLRIDRAELDLCEQRRSRIAFPDTELTFTNDFTHFEAEIARVFPAQIDGFRRLAAAIRDYDDVALDIREISAREVVRRYVTDPLLEDMLFCPLMFYGSARERDMDFSQFVIMAKSLFFEGFARPFDGVRRVIRVLLDKYRQAGGERRMKCGVARIIPEAGAIDRLVLDTGEEITADHVISSAGRAETARLLGTPPADVEAQAGALSFVETISVFNRQPAALGWGDDTIVFFNDGDRFHYEVPADDVDPRSGVICFPNNFEYGADRALPEGVFRVTCLANFDRWADLPEEAYQARKRTWFPRIAASARRFLPKPTIDPQTVRVTTDMFTPRTIRKFTGHLNGAVYGSPEKVKNGRTGLRNLYLCGTDQGFLGIVGAMLSGISMANYHVLQSGR